MAKSSQNLQAEQVFSSYESIFLYLYSHQSDKSALPTLRLTADLVKQVASSPLIEGPLVGFLGRLLEQKKRIQKIIIEYPDGDKLEVTQDSWRAVKKKLFVLDSQARQQEEKEKEKGSDIPRFSNYDTFNEFFYASLALREKQPSFVLAPSLMEEVAGDPNKQRRLLGLVDTLAAAPSANFTVTFESPDGRSQTFHKVEWESLSADWKAVFFPFSNFDTFDKYVYANLALREEQPSFALAPSLMQEVAGEPNKQRRLLALLDTLFIAASPSFTVTFENPDGRNQAVPKTE